MARVGWEDQPFTSTDLRLVEGAALLFGHDTEHALDFVVDLVNTAPSASTEERLPDLAALAAFVAAHQVSEVGELSEADLRTVQALRPALGAVFDCDDDVAAAAAVNALVAGAGVTPAVDRPRWVRLAHPLLRSGRVPRRAPRYGLRHGTGARDRCRRARAVAPMRGPRLSSGPRRPLPEPVQALLRRPHLRQPTARSRVPGAPARLHPLTTRHLCGHFAGVSAQM